MKRALLVMGNQILPAEMAVLEQKFDVIHLWKENDPEAVLQARKNDIVAIASAYFVPVARHLIEALPNLEIISQFAVGVDNIDLAAAKSRGIAVTNTPDVLTDDTADVVRPSGHFQPRKVFKCLAKAQRVRVRANAADALDDIQRLNIVAAFAGFFEAAVVVTDLDDRALHLLAVQRNLEAARLLEGRMLRPDRYNDLIIALAH